MTDQGKAIEHGRTLLLELGGNREESWQQSDKTFELAAQLADALAQVVGYPVYDEATGDYGYPTPSPEPVGGKCPTCSRRFVRSPGFVRPNQPSDYDCPDPWHTPVPAETAGESDHERLQHQLRVAEKAARGHLLTVERLQSALTRAEGRVQRLTEEIDKVLRWCAQEAKEHRRGGDRDFASGIERASNRLDYMTAALRAQPPLASSVVADEATTGEGRGDPLSPGCATPGCIYSGGHLGKCFEPGDVVPADEPSPLTGEEGKAERVHTLGQRARYALTDWQLSKDQGDLNDTLVILVEAVQALESRAAKGGG